MGTTPHHQNPWLLTLGPTEVAPAAAETVAAPKLSGDPWADEMWLAYMEEPVAASPAAVPEPPQKRVFSPTYSEATDTFTTLGLNTLYFGIDALANWRVVREN